MQLINGNAEWKAVVSFTGTVPAQLLGKLSVFYKHQDEFLNDLLIPSACRWKGALIQVVP